MICKQCGGEFDDHLASCPYCGEMNYQGAEAEYFEHLHDINKEMSEMGDDSQESYNSGMKKALIITAAVISGFILLAGIVIAIAFINFKATMKKGEEAMAQSISWKHQYYDDMDAMYAEEKYDELLQFLDDHAKDIGYYPYEWEHIDFIQFYRNYKNFLADTAKFDDGELVTMYWALYDTLYIETIDNLDYFKISDEENAIIDEWQIEAHAFLTDHMGLSEAEIEQLKKDTLYSNTMLPDSGKCKKYIKKKYNM